MTSPPSVFARDDTLFGICFAVGQDFGFNPLYLRIAFALFLFWSHTAAIGGYLALGALVAFSRWIAPDAPAPAEEASEREEEAYEDLPLAA